MYYLIAAIAYLSIFVVALNNDMPVQCATDMQCVLMYGE